MIGYHDGTQATPYSRTRLASTYPAYDWEDEATGGSSAALFASWGWTKVEKKALEDRKNPKFWALWFREFLDALLREGEKAPAALPPAFALPPAVFRCRSATLREREWKMKDWVQALGSDRCK